jgi:hypothetical protein
LVRPLQAVLVVVDLVVIYNVPFDLSFQPASTRAVAAPKARYAMEGFAARRIWRYRSRRTQLRKASVIRLQIRAPTMSCAGMVLVQQMHCDVMNDGVRHAAISAFVFDSDAQRQRDRGVRANLCVVGVKDGSVCVGDRGNGGVAPLDVDVRVWIHPDRHSMVHVVPDDLQLEPLSVFHMNCGGLRGERLGIRPATWGN